MWFAQLRQQSSVAQICFVNFPFLMLNVCHRLSLLCSVHIRKTFFKLLRLTCCCGVWSQLQMSNSRVHAADWRKSENQKKIEFWASHIHTHTHMIGRWRCSLRFACHVKSSIYDKLMAIFSRLLPTSSLRSFLLASAWVCVFFVIPKQIEIDSLETMNEMENENANDRLFLSESQSLSFLPFAISLNICWTSF